MKFTELNPRFVGSGGEGITDKDGNPVPERKGIGVSFDCPCGSKDCRRAFIQFSNPMDGGAPIDADGRHTWQRSGDTFETMSLTPSIQRMDNCRWHGFITNGEVIKC